MTDWRAATQSKVMRTIALSLLTLALCGCASVELKKNFCSCLPSGTWSDLATPPAEADTLLAEAWASTLNFGLKPPRSRYWYQGNGTDLLLCIAEPHDSRTVRFGTVELFRFSLVGSRYSLAGSQMLVVQPK